MLPALLTALAAGLVTIISSIANGLIVMMGTFEATAPGFGGKLAAYCLQLLPITSGLWFAGITVYAMFESDLVSYAQGLVHWLFMTVLIMGALSSYSNANNPLGVPIGQIPFIIKDDITSAVAGSPSVVDAISKNMTDADAVLFKMILPSLFIDRQGAADEKADSGGQGDVTPADIAGP